jgi:hypothetical protein
VRRVLPVKAEPRKLRIDDVTGVGRVAAAAQGATLGVGHPPRRREVDPPFRDIRPDESAGGPPSPLQRHLDDPCDRDCMILVEFAAVGDADAAPGAKLDAKTEQLFP